MRMQIAPSFDIFRQITISIGRCQNPIAPQNTSILEATTTTQKIFPNHFKYWRTDIIVFTLPIPLKFPCTRSALCSSSVWGLALASIIKKRNIQFHFSVLPEHKIEMNVLAKVHISRGFAICFSSRSFKYGSAFVFYGLLSLCHFMYMCRSLPWCLCEFSLSNYLPA